MNISFCWSANISESMCKNIVYEFALSSSTAPGMICLSYLDGLWDGELVALQLLRPGIF